MIGSFHNLKGPEDHAKQKAAFLIAICGASVVFLVWGYFFVANLTTPNPELDNTPKKETAFAHLKGLFSDLFAQVIIQKDKITSVFSEVKESTQKGIEKQTEEQKMQNSSGPATSTTPTIATTTQASTSTETEYQYN